MSATRRVPAYQLIDGVPRWPYLDPAKAREAWTYEPQEGDVVLVSYPRSGTTWTTQIIDLILHRGESASSYKEFVSRALSLETYGLANIEKVPPPRFILSHFQLLGSNFSAKAKYVYVARNPWDCCVSYFHMCRDASLFKFEDGTFDDFLEAFLTGDLCNGDYFEHVRQGYARRNDPNVFFFTYEALKADIPGTILKLAYFLGEEHGKALEFNERILSDVVNRSSLKFMSSYLEPTPKELAAIVNNFKDVNFRSTGICREDQPTSFKMFRKGQVNSWRECFTPEQALRLQTKLQEAAPELCGLWDMV